MKYSASLSKETVKTLKAVDQKLEARLLEKLRSFKDPKNKGKALKNLAGMYSLRTGSWRIFYTVNEDEGVVYAVAIRPRGPAYR